jgi:hypothetical protein
MFQNINNITAYKYFQKTKVVLFILILVVPFSYFLLYIDLFVTKLIFNIQYISMLRHLFEFSWWRIVIFSLIQYIVFTVLGSIYYHTGKVIIKNRDFFLS